LPAAGTVSYCATKHAVVGLSKALRIEAARHGVNVSVVCPGAIRTPILTGGRFGRTRFKGVTSDQILQQWETARPIEPAELARRTVDDVLKNVPIIVHPRWWKLLWAIDRLSPALDLKIWARMFAKLRKDLGQDEAETIVRPGPAPTTTNGNGSRVVS
jgi:short-subunit dehydrogenase